MSLRSLEIEKYFENLYKNIMPNLSIENQHMGMLWPTEIFRHGLHA